jgi:photosystem II stability/assembly factor-like uncharacterized protein
MKKQAIFSRVARTWRSVVVGTGCLIAISIAVAEQSATSQLSALSSKRVAQSLLQDIARIGDRLAVVGERGHIAVSDDNGKTWQQANVPTRQMLNAVYFASPERGWAVGYDGLILNTVDGGLNWTLQLDGLKFTRTRMAEKIPSLEAQVKELGERKLEAEDALADAEAGGDEDLSEFEDNVSEIEDQLSAIELDLDDARASLSDTVANPLMDVWFRDANTGFAVGAFGEFLKTENGGASWKSIAELLENPERNHLNAITGAGSLMYIAAEAGRIYRSVDAGAHWSLLESPDPENGSFFAVNIISAEQVMVSGLRGAMYRSMDKGQNWKQIPEDMHKNMNSVYFSGNDTVLAVGNDGAFLRSRDGGRTFLSHVRQNRLTIASVVEAADGSYVLVGAGGVQLVAPASL